MILYYAPGACSLADHIALHEAALRFDTVKIDLTSKRTEDGRDFREINPKGYVPALQLDDGSILTENIAILSWIADQTPNLAPDGKLGRYRLLEMLAFISTEIHKAFKPFFDPTTSDKEKSAAGKALAQRFNFINDHLDGDYLFGSRFTVADAYLVVMLMWAARNKLDLPDALRSYASRVKARPLVRLALEHEGLS